MAKISYSVDSHIVGEESGYSKTFDSFDEAMAAFKTMKKDFEPFGYTKDGYMTWVSGKCVPVKKGHMNDTIGTCVYMISELDDGRIVYERISDETYSTYEDYLDWKELVYLREVCGKWQQIVDKN